MSSLAQATILFMAALSIAIAYGLYKFRDVPACFDNEYFEEEER